MRDRDAFRQVCRLATGRTGPGLTLDEVADAGALADELAKPDSDPERVEALAARLDLKLDEVAEVAT